MPTPSAVEGGDSRYEGTIFGGMKFWVSLQDNGAKIVQLEKFADVLIADGLRKNLPPNSVSYNFIDKCIAENELVDIAPFRLTKGDVPRRVGSAQPTKGVRTKFTPADDQILVSWVRKHQEAGASIAGNEIYKELASRYPNHTWQSWQARWVKTLAYRPEQDLPDTIELPEQDESAVLDSTIRLNQKLPPAPTQGSRIRAPFTPEDDKLIFEYVQEQIRQGAKERGNVIYKKFEEQYPHHTAQSWRDRYVKYLADRDPSSFANKPSEPLPAPTKPQQSSPVAAPASTSPPTLQASSSSRPSHRPTASQPPLSQKPQVAAHGSSAPASSAPASSILGQGRQERLKRIKSAKKIQRAWARYTLRKTLARRYALREEQKAVASCSSSSSSLPAGPVEFPVLKVESDAKSPGGIKFTEWEEDEEKDEDAEMEMALGPNPRLHAFPRSDEAVRMFLRVVSGRDDLVEDFELASVVVSGRKEKKKVNLIEFWKLVVEEHGTFNGIRRELEWWKVAERLGLFDDGDEEMDYEAVERELRVAFRRYGLLEAWMAWNVFEEREWVGVERLGERVRD